MHNWSTCNMHAGGQGGTRLDAAFKIVLFFYFALFVNTVILKGFIIVFFCLIVFFNIFKTLPTISTSTIFLIQLGLFPEEMVDQCSCSVV